MISNSRKRVFQLVDKILPPVLVLVTGYFCFRTINSILNLPGSITISRVVLIAFPGLVAVICGLLLFFFFTDQSGLFRWLYKHAGSSRVQKTFEVLLPISWLLFITLAFLQPESLHGWTAIYERLQPLLLLGFVLVSCIWIYSLYLTRKNQVTDARYQFGFSGKAGLFFGLFVILVGIIIAISGKGIGAGTQYWGKTGVPILNWQLGVSWLLVVAGFYFFKPRSGWIPRHTDLIIFCLLWISAFFIWQSVPVPASRFNTTTYPPNFINYPFSDAADYALQAELILSGRGFTEGFVDKPLHLTFLACLNWLAGSNFSRLIMYQKAVLAVIPGLVFLIGLRLGGRPAGILAGLLVMFTQMNNLAIAPKIQSTNVSMTMSEPWTGLMLLLCCLALIKWWESPEGSLWLPALAGGVVGLAVLVRLNVMVLIPLVAIIWFIYSGFNKRKTWTSILIFSLAFLGTQIPWGVRNQVVFDEALKSYMSKTRGVLYKHRIKPVLNEPVSLEPTLVPYPDASGIEKQELPRELESKPANRYANLIDQMLHTGFHNLVTVGMAIPVSPYHTGLDQTVRLPYWDQEWDGRIVKGGWIVLLTSFLLLTAGFSRAWKQNTLLGVIPGVILVSYLGANTASMVSGGRYIVPVDWVLPLYYGMGVWTITSSILVGLRNEELTADLNIPDVHVPKVGSQQMRYIGMVIIIGLACLPAVLGLLNPAKQQTLTKKEVLDRMKISGVELPTNVNWDTLEEFAKYDESIFVKVTAMYPRWMKTGEGDTGGAGSAFSPLPFDHLSFVAIDGESNTFNVVLPVNQQISYLPDASEVYVIGCAGENYVDSVLLSIIGKETITYSRPVTTTLICPLPTP